jgi:hypothetical protein
VGFRLDQADGDEGAVEKGVAAGIVHGRRIEALEGYGGDKEGVPARAIASGR